MTISKRDSVSGKLYGYEGMRKFEIVSKKTKVAAALGAAAICTYAAERFGVAEQLPDGVRQIVTSLAHPFVGFVGAWVGDKVKRGSDKTMFFGATIANFAVEAAQSATVKYPGYYNFLAMGNLPETAKDYAFALAGMSLYRVICKKDKAK